MSAETVLTDALNEFSAALAEAVEAMRERREAPAPEVRVEAPAVHVQVPAQAVQVVPSPSRPKLQLRVDVKRNARGYVDHFTITEL